MNKITFLVVNILTKLYICRSQKTFVFQLSLKWICPLRDTINMLTPNKQFVYALKTLLMLDLKS